MNLLYSTVNSLRDKYTPVTSTSTFRKTGQITPDEFIAAGDYLVFKFPTWSWADADPESKRVSYLPAGKQFLVTRNVPCNRRLDADFAGDAGHEEAIVNDGEDFKSGAAGGDDDGWLRTGGLSSSQPLKVREIRTVDDAGNVGDGQVIEDDDDIPDMEDEDDDEAIIPDAHADGGNRYGPNVMRRFARSALISSFAAVADERTPFISCTRPTTEHRDFICRVTRQAASLCSHSS